MPWPLLNLATVLCCALDGVVRASSGAPIDRADIVLAGAAQQRARTGADGTFAPAAPPGTYRLSVSAGGFAPLEVARVRVRRGTRIEVTLEPLGTLGPREIGRVTVDGRLALPRTDVPQETISRRQLDAAGSLRLLDALAAVPGATLSRPDGGAASAVAVVSLRGPDPSETVVSLDGQSLNNGNTGDFDFSQLPVAPFAAIHVSGGLGRDDRLAASTIGGGIELQTLGPTRDPQGAAQLAYGSFDTRAISLQRTGTRARLGYALAATNLTQGGYVRGFPALFAPPEGSSSPNGAQLGSGIFAQSALANLVWTFTDRASVRVRYFTLANRRDVSAALDAPLEPMQDRPGGLFAGPGAAQFTQGLRALLLAARAPLGAGSLVTSYAVSGATTTFAGGTASSPYDTFTNDRTATLKIEYERALPTFSYALGGYTRDERLDEGATFLGAPQGEHSQGLSLRGSLQATRRLTLHASAFLGRYSDFSLSPDGRFGATYDVDERSALRASVGTGFRAPLLAEKFVLPLAVLQANLPGDVDANCVAANGNAAERPEHVTAYEAGYARRLSERTTFDAALYRTNLRDPIENAYPLGAHCPSSGVALAGQVVPVNVGRVVYEGAALRLTHAAGAFALQAAYGLNVAYPLGLPATVANPTSGANLVPYQQFQSIPIQTGAVGMQWKHRALHAALELSYRGRNNELNARPYALLGGAAGVVLGRTDVALAFRNVTGAEAGRFTRLGGGLPYPSPFSTTGSLPTDRYSLEPAAIDLLVTLR